MNPLEHYQESERCLKDADLMLTALGDKTYGLDHLAVQQGFIANKIATAQVHATLANIGAMSLFHD